MSNAIASELVIESDSVVQLHFEIRLEDGSIAESTRQQGRPAKFQMGKEVFSDAFEAEILGLKVGEKKKVLLMPADAFGEAHPANIYAVPRKRFDESTLGQPLEEGLIIAFTQPNGQDLPGIVREIGEDEVTIDFNHPLAGKPVLFDLEVIAIET